MDGFSWTLVGMCVFFLFLIWMDRRRSRGERRRNRASTRQVLKESEWQQLLASEADRVLLAHIETRFNRQVHREERRHR